MQREEEKSAEVQEWLQKALDDLQVADYLLRATPPFVSSALFHAQQAAEKSLKGFLTWHEVIFRKTHSIEELGGQCLRVDNTLRPIIDRAVPLTQYASRFRYPGEMITPDVKEARQALDIAREVYGAVVSRLASAGINLPPA